MAKGKILQSERRFFGAGLPKVKLKGLTGKFIVIDGPEGSGCSLQAKLLLEAYERAGFPTMQIGTGQSEVIGAGLQEVLKANFLSPYTLNLFSATEIADQLENKVIPSLKAGFVVVADRYIFSPIAKGIVRGVPVNWLSSLYGFALVPDYSIMLDAAPTELAQRCVKKSGALGFWESGRDCVTSADIYDGFLEYQGREQKALKKISKMYSATTVNANYDPDKVHSSVLRIVGLNVLGGLLTSNK